MTRDIYAGGRPVALYVVKRDNAANTNSSYTRYLHTDHLGSVDTITSETGAVLERLSYDTWGKRRNANGSDSVTQLTSNIDHHGYTGHEMNDSVGLINMNGRWYDPTLGRFMQADPTIQAPGNSQSYNRYSYVLNNPLSMTDPSGFNWLSKKWHKFYNKNRAYIAILAQVALAAAGCPVCGGLVAGYVSTGTLKGALTGAATAYAFGALGTATSRMGAVAGAATRAVAGGAMGGLIASAQAGGSWSAFKSMGSDSIETYLIVLSGVSSFSKG